MSHTDTIAAVATPPGTGGVGIVRVSGPNARRIGTQLTGHGHRARIFHFSTFRDASGAALDRGLSVLFAAPASFTGEDVLELHAHGSPIVLDLLLRRVCELGARPARAGEFSERAFLNGKLDLAQAEAIADLIAAGSEAQARAALRSLEGEFSARVRAVFDALVRLRAWLEAALDFPEEEIDFLSAPQLRADLGHLRLLNAELLEAAHRGAVLRDGLHVVIIGRPNAGKSSLLNALAETDRAIVTPVPGTTRDVLRETVRFGGITLTLVDTAGLRDTADVVEQEGVRRAYAELARADVIILVTDDANEAADRALLPAAETAVARLIVHNKIDIDGTPARTQQTATETRVWLSARTGEGVGLLREELARRASGADVHDGAFSARSRHVQALQRVAETLDSAHAHLTTGAGELAAEDLRRAQQALGEITGTFSSDDLLGAIFADFCIGK